MHRNQRYAAILASLIWAGLCSFSAVYQFRFGNGAWSGFIVLLVGWTPVALTIFIETRIARRNSELQQAFIKEAGLAAPSSLAYLHEKWGIAINSDDLTVTLMERGKFKRYSFDDVIGYRTWEVEIRHPGNTLFIRVRDSGKPEWTIPMEFQQELHRWAQIFALEVIEAPAESSARTAA
jgi:hypothetical protein